MYVIVPMSNVGSPQKRDRFTELLTDVADVTIATEPEAVAYAWFRSAEDNDAVPHHWVRGLEVYAQLEASTVTHRASAPYKAFRAACGEEKLLDRGSDLRYMEPLDIGFMKRTTSPVVLQRTDSSAYVVFESLKPKEGQRGALLQLLKETATAIESLGDAVQSFWTLGYRAEDNDATIVLFERFASRDTYAKEFASNEIIKMIRGSISDLCETQQLTTWVDAGIGFIGR